MRGCIESQSHVVKEGESRSTHFFRTHKQIHQSAKPLQHFGRSQDTINAPQRFPPSHQTHLHHRAPGPAPASNPNPTEMSDVVAVEVVATHIPKKQGTNYDLHPASKSKQQQCEINDLKKDKDRLHKRVTCSQTKIGSLEAEVADAQTKLRTQQAQHKDSMARLNGEKEAAEKRARKAEKHVDSQQSQIDALYAKTRTVAIADA